MVMALHYEARKHMRVLYDKDRWGVLTMLIMHANVSNRCWPSVRTLALEMGISPNKISTAKSWLLEHKAIELVPHKKRVGKELKCGPRQHVYQLTGSVEIEGKCIPYFLTNPEVNDIDHSIINDTAHSNFNDIDHSNIEGVSESPSTLNDIDHSIRSIRSDSLSNLESDPNVESIKAKSPEGSLPDSEPSSEIESPEPSKQELEPTPPSSAAPPLPLLAPPGLRWIYRTDMTRHTVGANANQPTKTKCCNEPVGSYAGLVGNPLEYAECAEYTVKAQRSITFSDEIKNAFSKLCKKDWRIKSHATQMNGALSQLSATGAVTIELLRRFYANWYKCDFRGQKQQAPSPHQVVDKWTEYTESDDCREETFNGTADNQQASRGANSTTAASNNGREPGLLADGEKLTQNQRFALLSAQQAERERSRR